MGKTAVEKTSTIGKHLILEKENMVKVVWF